MIPLRTSIKRLTLGPLMEPKLNPERPGSPRMAKGAPREGQRHPVGTHMMTKRRPRPPKRSQRKVTDTPKGSQRASRMSRRRPKSGQRRPKEAQRAQLYIQTPDQPPKRPLCYFAAWPVHPYSTLFTATGHSWANRSRSRAWR